MPPHHQGGILLNFSSMQRKLGYRFCCEIQNKKTKTKTETPKNNVSTVEGDIFAERAYYLELTGAKEAEAGFKYPRVAFENAPAPDQYDPDAVNSNEGSIFDEMMDEFGEFDGDDSYDDEY